MSEGVISGILGDDDERPELEELTKAKRVRMHLLQPLRTPGSAERS